MCYLYSKDPNRIDDVTQQTMLALFEMNQEVLKDIYHKDGINGIIRYAAIIIRRSFCGTKNKYYYLYRRYYTLLDDSYSNTTMNDEYKKSLENIAIQDEVSTSKKLQILDKAMNELYWYDRELTKLYYYKGHTLDSLAKKTGIARNSIHTTIKKTRKMLKDVLRKERS